MLVPDVGSAVMSSGAAVTSEEEMSLKSLTMFPLQQSADELHAPAAVCKEKIIHYIIIHI